jgi:hypothetical protein
MTSMAASVPLLVFEAADCLMAIPAVEVAHLENGPDSYIQKKGQTLLFDLGEYFGGCESDGPWLQWTRGTCNASLRVKRVVDVVSIALSSLAPMPVLFGGQRRTRAFLAAGVAGQDVFLLLDPARLGGDTLKVTTAGCDFSRAKTE